MLKLLRDKRTVINYNINQKDNNHRYNTIKKTIKDEILEIDKNISLIKNYLS